MDLVKYTGVPLNFGGTWYILKLIENPFKPLDQAPKFGFTNNQKTLKIPVFGGLWVYLVIFVFVSMTPEENLVLFDL